MKKLFKSEITGKVYESEQECLNAEREHKQKLANINAEKEERKELADKIKNSYEEYLNLCSENRKRETELYNKYIELRNEFINKFGSYHLTITQKNDLKPFIDFENFNKMIGSFLDTFWTNL